MFIKGRGEIREVIHLLQRTHCCYDMTVAGTPPPICDCKYGYSGKGGYGEDTGCPELRCVVELLSLMTDDEYEKIMARGNNYPV